MAHIQYILRPGSGFLSMSTSYFACIGGACLCLQSAVSRYLVGLRSGGYHKSIHHDILAISTSSI